MSIETDVYEGAIRALRARRERLKKEVAEGTTSFEKMLDDGSTAICWTRTPEAALAAQSVGLLEDLIREFSGEPL